MTAGAVPLEREGAPSQRCAGSPWKALLAPGQLDDDDDEAVRSTRAPPGLCLAHRRARRSAVWATPRAAVDKPLVKTEKAQMAASGDFNGLAGP